MPGSQPTPAGDAGGGGRAPKTPAGTPEDERDPRRTPEELAGYAFDKEEVRRAIERHFRVYDERDALPGFDRALLVAFYVQADRATIEERLPVLQEELRRMDPQLAPMFREEGGETIIIVARRPPELLTRSSRLPLVLFLISLLTLTAGGTLAWIGYQGHADLAPMLEPVNIAWGFLTFTVPLLFYFGVQEAARRLVARRHRIPMGASLIVPVPPFLFIPSIGTFGSIGRPKALPANRRALFDLAATGAVAGFAAAVLLVVVGLQLTVAGGVVQTDGAALTLEVTAPDGTRWSEESDDALFTPFQRSEPDDPFQAHNVTLGFQLPVEGRPYGTTGWNLTVLATGPGERALNHSFAWSALDAGGEPITHNETAGSLLPGERTTHLVDLPDGTATLRAVVEYHVPARTSYPLGEPLAFTALTALLVPAGSDLVLHPTGLAGWAALLVTGIVLLPVGRFDGGAVARAVLGDRMTILGYITIGFLAVLSFFYVGWVYLVLFILLFLSVRHPVPLDDTSPLDPGRRALILVLALILVVSFTPVPALLEGTGFLR